MTQPATTSVNTYAKDLALSYIASGLPIFPCRHADEVTDDYDPDTGEIIVLKSKTPLVSRGFKSASKSERIASIVWDLYPHAMVGIPTGEEIGAWVLDVDVHEDENGNVVDGYATLAALEEKHGPLPKQAVAKTAGGGEHHYFKHVAGLRNRGKLGRGLDVRGSGGYVIAPGSVVADGRKYEWLNYNGTGLPDIPEAPQWILDLIIPKTVESVSSSTSSYTSGRNGNISYVNAAIDAELQDLASTPQGERNNKLYVSSSSLGNWVAGGYLTESEAIQDLEHIAVQWPNFTLSKKTIKNGLKNGLSNPRHPPEPSYHNDNTPTQNIDGFIANSLAKQDAKRIAADANNDDHATNAPIIDEDDYQLEVISDLESLTYPGGLVEDIIDWIVCSAEQPNRTLALAAALPLVAALAGSRYSTGSRDTRPNIYTVALADSGFGKEHGRSQIKRLLMESKGILDKFGGPARIMSASALREVLESNSSVNCQIDEFGGFIRDITDRSAGSHQRAISTDLRDYYSASSTFFEGAAYRGSPPKRIYNPNLCIHGTSTPEQFWSALSSASAEDGLLPRLIMFLVEGEKKAPVKPERDVRWVPISILERMCDVAGVNPVAERTKLTLKQAMENMSNVETKATVVPWTDDAILLFANIRHSVDDNEARLAPESRPFIRRILENTVKLALIVAVGTDPHNPVITEANLEWAASVAWSCSATMIKQVIERLSDNQREANYKKISGIIKKAGSKGITMGRLVEKIKAIDKRMRDEIIGDIRETGKVNEVTMQPEGGKGGRPAKRLVWVSS